VLRPVHLSRLIEDVVHMMETETGNRGCSLESTLADDLPAVLADALQVQLVLVNLLQNAVQSVRSGDHGDTRISIDARPGEEGEVQIGVIDRGPGVPADRVADIFEPLYSGTSGGMGMGLAVSRAIVEAHGGRIWYEPNPGGGAIFRFTLRAAYS